MSELTDRVRKMLSQAQVFATDTPFEAVSRARQVIAVIDEALNDAALGSEDRTAILGLRKLAESRLEKYEARLAAWLSASSVRATQFVENERERLAQPMRAKV
jgi:hypothetical protein